MRRSICLSEPNITLAGTVSTWKFTYTTANHLPKGTLLRFDMSSKGREIDWQTPSSNLKAQSNVIYAQLESGKVISASEVDQDDRIVPYFIFKLPEEVAIGSSIVIFIGSPPSQTPSKTNGNACQKLIQRRKTFFLAVDPTGAGNFTETEPFYIDIKGNLLHHMRVITPSFVVKNKRFDVIIRFEDQFGNLTSRTQEGTLIELSYENLRENLNWKLFVPETGFITLPNLYFNETGVYKIQLKNLADGSLFYSYPIKCFADNTDNLYWGIIHGESERVDSTESIDSCLRHFRDEMAMNFFAASSPESEEETPSEIWKLVSNSISEFNEEDRFTTFLGFQFLGQGKAEGVRQIIYRKDGKPILRQKDTKTNTLKKIYKTSIPKDFISIPSFTMGGEKYGFDFDDFTPEFERVVEIYNAWGSSECTLDEGNPRPITSAKKRSKKANAEGSIRKALRANKRFGFVAGGLDDRFVYSDFYESDQVQYSPGLTGIISEKHSRESMFEALYNRSCYATTGQRIILGFSIAGVGMGKETDTTSKPGLAINRHIAGYVAGTAKIDRIEIIRNGDLLTTITCDGTHTEFTYDDMEPLQNICLKDSETNIPFVFYYIRVFQEDEHMAWGSPIWIDYTGKTQATAKKERAKKS